jgi:hypothetical protein
VKTYPKQIQVTSDGKESEVTKLNDAPALQTSGSPSGTFYKVNGKLYEATYQRLLIRHVEAER